MSTSTEQRGLLLRVGHKSGAMAAMTLSLSEQQRKRQIRDFEILYDAEFERYVEENKKDSTWNTFKKYPIRNLILVTLAGKSYRSFCQATFWILSTGMGNGRMGGDVLDLCTKLEGLFVLGAAVFLGYFLADFLTGLIHLLCDNIPLQLKTMKSGRSFMEYAAFGFHYHHIHPTDWNINNLYFGAILRAGFQFYVPITVLTLWTISAEKSPFLLIVLLTCSHTGLFVQLSHAASHGRFQGNRLVAFLQNYRIILHPSIHKIHHQEFNQNYAILNGYSNGLLNSIYKYLVQPNAPASVSAETQKKLYYEKKVPMSLSKGDSTYDTSGKDTERTAIFDVRTIQPRYVIFPDYRKHKGCPI